MDEIIHFIQISNNVHTRNITRTTYYSICTDMGSIYFVQDNGHMYRKANVHSHQDIRMLRQNGIRILTEIRTSNPNIVTILIKNQATVSLMYCHRTIQVIDSSCRKIILCGSSFFIFGDMGVELQETDNPLRALSSDDRKAVSGDERKIPRCPPHPPNNYFPLLDKDEIELSGNGHFFIRVSSNRHCVYVDPTTFKSQVRYKSSDSVSKQKLDTLANNLAS